MVGVGRQSLRDLFDESPTPLIGHPPRTHHLDYYVATDGSYRGDGGGLGAVIEAVDGTRVDRVARADESPDNNVAEYRALHLGLDVLADRVPRASNVGVLVDHAELATNVNASVLGRADPEGRRPVRVAVPPAAVHHWRGIEARLAALADVRAAMVDGTANPAHPLANDPGAFAHLERGPGVTPPDSAATAAEPETFPPPSRAGRRRSD